MNLTQTKSSPAGWFGALLSLIAGAIYPLAFAPLNWWPLALFSVAALWWLLNEKSAKTALWLGFSYGFGVFGAGTSWVYVSINTFGNAPPALAILLTLLSIALLAILFGVFAWTFRKICLSRWGKGFSKTSQIIFFCLLWLGLDLIRGSGFISFPWLYLGYSQTGQALMGIASLFGVHGLTLYLTGLSLLLAELVMYHDKRVSRWLLFTAYLLLGTAASWFGLSGKIEQKETLRLALIQPNIDQHKKWDRAYFGEIVSGLLEQSENYWGADLLVWPEAAIPAMDSQVDWLLKDLQKKSLESNTTFITGIPIFPKSENTNSKHDVYYAGIKSFGNNPSEYRKQQLVPFGEYLPFESMLRGLIDFFNLPMSSFSVGASDQIGLEADKVYLVPAICYEIAFSGLIQELASKNQDSLKGKAILTISNDTWFGKSWGPLQHFQMAKMRAIENGLPLIRGTNNGLTAVVNHYGQVIEQKPRFEKSVLAATLPLEQRESYFAQYGYLPLWLLSFLLVSFLLTGLIRK